MSDYCEPHDEKSGHESRGGVLGFLGKAALVSWMAAIAAMKTFMGDGTVAAIAREAVKDVRNTTHEVFFGQSEHAGEVGAPLNPTQGEVASSRQETVHDPLPLRSPSEIAAAHRETGAAVEPLRSPSEIAAAHSSVHESGPNGVEHGTVHDGPERRSPSEIAAAHMAHGQEEHGEGQILTHGPNEWTEREMDRRKGREEDNGENDQGWRGRVRSLPQEEKQKEHERERDRGRER